MTRQTLARRTDRQDHRPHVVIIGAGFGGLSALRSLASAPVRVTVVDRTNHHLFQPLLYQVATAALSPADIAAPTRSIVRDQENATVLLDEVRSIDVAKREIVTGEGPIAYDYLIVAAGAETSYFGHDEWEAFAPGLKTLDDATDIRRRVLLAFEDAERAQDEGEEQRLLTFVVVGGGATGVEMAGALAELAQRVLAADFRTIHPEKTRVILLDAGERLLAAFPPDLSASAEAQLSELGVVVRKGAHVTRIDERGIHIGDELLEAKLIVWAAGVKPSPLAASLGVPLDRQGRVVVLPDMSIPGHPEVFVIGDMALALGKDGEPLPGQSPVAIQAARFVAGAIVGTIEGRPRGKFSYFDKGSMATIGRSRAVAMSGPFRMSGLVAWLAWLVVHLFFLIGFKNRIAVLFSWFYSYVAFRRGARLITTPHAAPTRRSLGRP